jgi:predicted transcriptional regulator
MSTPSFNDLSRRERQVLDLVYGRGRATANEVMDAMPDPPSYSSVRSVLRLLEKKGLLRHESDGPRHVYIPVIRRDRARRSALKHLLKTFFDDSPEEVVTALLDVSKSTLSKDELAKIEALIKGAKEDGR